MSPPTSSLSFLCLILLFAYFPIILSETIQLTGQVSLEERSIYYVDNSMSIVNVNDYLTAFVWKRIFETEHLDESLLLSNEARINFLNEETSKLSIGVEKRLYSEFQSFVSFHQITNMKVHYFTFSGDACRNPKNVLLQYDILFSTLEYFYDYLRLYRDSNSSTMINSSDFVPLPLVPSILNVISQSQLTQLTNLNQLNGYFTLNNYSSSNSQEFTNETLNSSITTYCSSYIDKDSNNVKYRLKTFGNITASDLNYIKFVSGISLQNIEYGIFDKIVKNTLELYNITYNYYNMNGNDTISQLLNNFLPSTCHKCVTTQCVDFTFVSGDYWLIPCSIIEIGYFLCLFMSQSFLKRSITRRLLVPYLPIFIVPLEICFSTFMNNACYYFLRYFSMIVVCFIVMNYSLTVLRYYYLRNLYTLIKKAEGISNDDKLIHRMRKYSEWKYGMLFTVLVPLLIAIIFSIHGVTFFFTDLYDYEFTYLLVGNASIVVYCVIGCLLGFCAIVFDMVANRKIIKEKGLASFLLFDDPFLVRIDLLLLVFLIVSTILVIIFYGSGTSEFFIEMSRFFRFLVFVCFMFICGGTVLISELVQFIRKSKYGHDTTMQSSLNELEIYLKNSEFQILLKEYASKEMSIENYLLYMDLQKIISKKGIDRSLEIDDIRDIERKYMKYQSIFEINIPSIVRRNFFELLLQCENALNDNVSNNSNKSDKKIKVRQLIEILHPSVFGNLSDTFLRLASTKEFKTWRIAYSIQNNTIN